MRNHVPSAPKLGTLPARHAGAVLQYRFLTPVFGGGVKVVEGSPKKPFDPVTPVRAPALRGVLRFWWRAVNPRKIESVARLREVEQEIFGGVASTPKRSALVVRIRKQPGEPKPLKVLRGKFDAEPGFENISYGAFPLRHTGGEDHGALHDYGKATFEVELRFPDEIADDVRAALWAFGHFGGLGGRTRRGFGAVHLEACTWGSKSCVMPSIDEGWAKWVAAREVPWPHLGARTGRCVLTTDGYATGIQAQGEILRRFRDFRQARRPGEGRRPGRSYWPEPDAIRTTLGQAAPSHRTRVTHADVFPRAEFGLPIIFYFKDGREGDPRDSTLLPVIDGHAEERWASPLILRPHVRAGGTVAGLALWLRHPTPAALRLKTNAQSRPVRGAISADEARALDKSPLVKDGRTYISVIERFLKEIER